MTEKSDWKKDAAYISYIERGESAAVFVVRDIVDAIETKGKWIDVISLSTYNKKGAEDRKAFNWIIVELFPRKIQPQYDTQDLDYNRYLTWVTAHEDIEHQRKAGFRGEKYLVLCNLVNKNKNKFTTHTVIAKKYWEPMEAYRTMEIKDPVKPRWAYQIKTVKQVNAKQVNYIEKNKMEIEEGIRKNRKPTLELLGL